MENVLERIVASKKMPILFIGSGISKRYLYKYPNWDELLYSSFKQVDKDPFYFQKHKDSLTRDFENIFDVNIRLASIIEKEYNSAFYDRKVRIGNNKNPNWARRGISPYKMFLSKRFKDYKLYKRAHLDKERAEFKLLKNKISAVVTTNYDTFLEDEIFPNDYKVFKRQNELFTADSYNIAEIYKIHGCVTDAESIIITQRDYDNFNDSRKLFIAKMLTLFTESPIIFLGYSFTDENIQNIITDFLGCLTHRELEDIEDHFVFISYKKQEHNLNEIRRTITTASGNDIPITEIRTDNYFKVYQTLNKITPGISPVRIRETRRLVKTIVDQGVSTGDAESIIVGIDDLNDINLANKPLAIAIGYKEQFNTLGYSIISDSTILEDILYDNKNLDPTAMCNERFKSLPSTRLMPVFKYIKLSGIEPDPESKLFNFVKVRNSVDKIISNNVEKYLKNYPVIKDYSVLMEKLKDYDINHKKSSLLLKNITYLNTQEVRDACIKLYESDRADMITKANFKRCVMYLDLIENYTG